MESGKRINKYVPEEQYVLRVRDQQLADRIRSTLRDEGKAANSSLEVIFDGEYMLSFRIESFIISAHRSVLHFFLQRILCRAFSGLEAMIISSRC